MSLLSTLKPGLTGLDQLLALLDAGRQPSIHETLNIALISAREGAVVVEARPSESYLNPAGTVAGGRPLDVGRQRQASNQAVRLGFKRPWS